MATTMVASNRMIVCYNNQITKANYVGVTPGNVTTASGSSTNNLLDEQVATQWVSNTPTADPYLQFEHNSTLDITNYYKYIAFVNTAGVIHTYESVKIATSNTAGSGYTTLGEADLNLSYLGLAFKGQYDIILKLGSSSNQKYLRAIFHKTSGWTPITVGAIWAFQGYEVPKNPSVNGFTTRHVRQMESRRSLGGIRHIARGNDYIETSSAYSFNRVNRLQKFQLVDIVKQYGRRPCGIIEADQAPKVMPEDDGHKIVYLNLITATAQPGDSATEAQYDVTIEATGVY